MKKPFRLPNFLRRRLESYVLRIIDEFDPNLIIDRGGEPYLRRWWIIPRNGIFNIYVHEFLSSDDLRALHDHPYPNLSILVTGRYLEHTIAAGGVKHATLREAGDFKFRLPSSAHAIEILSGEVCLTIFITGPRLRHWGFHCPNAWKKWEDFVSVEDGGKTHGLGRGCD